MKLPVNLQAERAIIGAILFSEGEAFRFANELEVTDFYGNNYQIIFTAMKNLSKSNKPIDFTTLTEELLNMQKLEVIGGVKALQEIYDETLTASNITYHINLVKDRSLLRQLVVKMQELVDNWENPENKDVSTYISKVENDVLTQ